MANRDTEVNNLIINELTKAEFDSAEKSETELYFVTDDKVQMSEVEGLTDTLNYKANTDLSNLTQSGRYKFDGQWVSTGEIRIASNVPVTSNVTGPTYNLSEYLPQDNYNYEIILQCLIESTTTLNNFFYISVNTGIITTELCRVRTTATSNNTNASSTTVLPIDTNRQLTLLYSTSNNFRGTINSIVLKAYRRLGSGFNY